MEINRCVVNIKLDDNERIMLKFILCGACEICNRAVSRKDINESLIGTGPKLPFDVASVVKFAEEMESQSAREESGSWLSP